MPAHSTYMDSTFILLLKKHFLYSYVFVGVCLRLYLCTRWMQSPRTLQKDTGSPGTRAIGGCALPLWVLETELWCSIIAARTPVPRATSRAPLGPTLSLLYPRISSSRQPVASQTHPLVLTLPSAGLSVGMEISLPGRLPAYVPCGSSCP